MGPRPKLVALHPVHGYAVKPTQDLKTSKRNARERKRVETVNSGFEILRQHIPSAMAAKKMSKVNILSHAMEYISQLHAILESKNQSGGGAPHHQYQDQTYQYPPSYGQYTPEITSPAPSSASCPLFSNTSFSYTTQNESGYDSEYSFLPSPAIPNAWHQPNMSPHPRMMPSPMTAPSLPSQISPMPLRVMNPSSQPSPMSPMPPRLMKHSSLPSPAMSDYSSLASPASWPQSPIPSQSMPAPTQPSPQQKFRFSPVSVLEANAEDEGNSSGEEDDILDAIAEWQDKEETH